MSVFFIGWELWQQMTFVLACCIVLVFTMGLGKLWWSNRSMRQLEVIDEEKRARVSVLSHCGINAWRPPEIPFGVRAIQNGVEVEGIWISRSNTPDTSRVASSTFLGSTTLVEDPARLSKGKEKMVDPLALEHLLTSSLKDSERPSSHPLLPPGGATTHIDGDPTAYARRHAPNSSGSNLSLPKPFSDSYNIPKEMEYKQHRSDMSSTSLLLNPLRRSSLTPTLYSSKNTSMVDLDSDPPISKPPLHQTPEVIINRNTRRATRRCVMVPAGSGRFHLDPSTEDTHNEGSMDQQRLTTENKLKKSAPVRAQLRKTTAYREGGRDSAPSDSG